MVALVAVYAAVVLLYPPIFEAYTGVVNAPLTYDSSVRLTNTEFEALASRLMFEAARLRAHEGDSAEADRQLVRDMKTEILLRTRSFQRSTGYRHVELFRQAGIRQYEGPSTCLQCHPTIRVQDHIGNVSDVKTLDDVADSVHFQFQRIASGFSTLRFDGREVNGPGSRAIPVGKIDRACGIPGSFAWTGWAALVESKPEEAEGKPVLRSEGCGQCHIGGGYHPATEKMMPFGEVPRSIKEGIDCLICHSQTYDMNYRYVIQDKYGTRWNQDRTMRAALTVGMPTSENCLYCHQHNMGGDAYPQNAAADALGFKNKRLLHAGAKRGNAWHSSTDVHAGAGIQCLDCHIPQGHKIPRGPKATDLVANDLPGVEVSCERCHSTAPHISGTARTLLNGHVARVACETCHIRELEPYNVVLRDWVSPEWDAKEGIHVPRDILRSGEPGIGLTYLWFNGNGTFLANALGTNPSHPGNYNPLMQQMTRMDPERIDTLLEPVLRQMEEQDPGFKRAEYVRAFTDTLSQLPKELIERRSNVVDDKMRPIMERGQSRIYPFKLFNARMYEDVSNRGPFGSMILPFDYKTYYETGKSADAVKAAISHPIARRMYQQSSRRYMSDEFMSYFGVDKWNTAYPLENGELRNVEAHWMRQMGTLMVNHGIQARGRGCMDCHSPAGILDWKALGYPEDRAKHLANLPEAAHFRDAVAGKP